MKTFYSIFSVLIFMSFLTCEGEKSEIIFHKSHEPSRANVPFSDAVETENLLFLKGQIGKHHKTGQLVSGGIEAETKQVMENIKAVLEAATMTFENVIKTSIFIADMHQFAKINTVYGSYFDEATAPARETVEVANLPKFVNLEISVIAVI